MTAASMESHLTPASGLGDKAPPTDNQSRSDLTSSDLETSVQPSSSPTQNADRVRGAESGLGSQVPVPDFAALDTDLMIPALHDYLLARLEEEKASDIVSISLEGKSEIADAMLIASGRSARHVSAIAEKLVSSMKSAGLQDMRIEGQPSCDWVLIDAGDIIIHLFRPEVRDFYNLERIWSETARAEISDIGAAN